MKRLNKAVAAIALSIPLMGASALAFDIDSKKGSEPHTGMTEAMKKDMEPQSAGEQKSCGEAIAEGAPSFEKSAALMNKLADAYTAHAEWVGQNKAAKQERAALMKAATAYRDMGKRMTTMSKTLEMQRDVKDAPHDMASPKLDRAAQLSMEAAQLQAELATELETAAQQMQASAQQLQSMRGVGGAGEEGQEPMNEEQPQQQPMEQQPSTPDDARQPMDDTTTP